MVETLDPRSEKRLPLGIHSGVAGQREFTLHDVSAAISKQLHLPPELNEVAGLAGKLHSFVNASPVFQKSGLDGAGFRTLVMTNLSRDVERLMDPVQLAKLRAEQNANSNPTGAQPGVLGALAGRQNGQRLDGMSSAGGGNEVSSFARRQAEVEAQAYALAGKLGLDWAKNNPDLLRLGPSAIQALADVQLRQDSFQRFKNVGFDEKTIVAGAKYAKRNNVDYNDASKKIEETDKELSPEGKVIHRKATEELFNCKPGEEETAKKKYNDTVEDGLKNESPKAHEKLRDEQKVLKTLKAKEHAAEKKADVSVETAKKDVAAKQTTKSKLLATLD